MNSLILTRKVFRLARQLHVYNLKRRVTHAGKLLTKAGQAKYDAGQAYEKAIAAHAQVSTRTKTIQDSVSNEIYYL